jgi:hypothetical protein
MMINDCGNYRIGGSDFIGLDYDIDGYNVAKPHLKTILISNFMINGLHPPTLEVFFLGFTPAIPSVLKMCDFWGCSRDKSHDPGDWLPGCILNDCSILSSQQDHCQELPAIDRHTTLLLRYFRNH